MKPLALLTTFFLLPLSAPALGSDLPRFSKKGKALVASVDEVVAATVKLTGLQFEKVEPLGYWCTGIGKRGNGQFNYHPAFNTTERLPRDQTLELIEKIRLAWEEHGLQVEPYDPRGRSLGLLGKPEGGKGQFAVYGFDRDEIRLTISGKTGCSRLGRRP